MIMVDLSCLCVYPCLPSIVSSEPDAHRSKMVIEQGSFKAQLLNVGFDTCDRFSRKFA
jgi:hypothetical protein